MDYARIYREFIADRRAREQSLSGYTEKHHIIPRSAGGADEPSNLILLTPEKITLKNADGLLVSRSRSEWNEAGFSHARLCQLLNGRQKSCLGWLLPETDAATAGRSAAGKAKRGKEKFAWVHDDGRSFIGTPFDLAASQNRRADDFNAVARGKHATCYGWSIAGTKTGWPCGRKSFRDLASYDLATLDGRRATGTQADLVKLTRLSQQEVNDLVRGRRRSACGWMTKEELEAGYVPRAWRSPLRAA